eukprot:2607072-Karenia_brevis.AAC.1
MVRSHRRTSPRRLSFPEVGILCPALAQDPVQGLPFLVGDGQNDTWHMVRARVESLGQAHISLQVCRKIIVVELVV